MSASATLHRRLTEVVVEALRSEPVVVITGARQVGKTTIVRTLARGLGGTYVSSTWSPRSTRPLTLDDAEVLAAARADPASVLRGAREPIVIDEFQRVPELLLATKALVDRIV